MTINHLDNPAYIEDLKTVFAKPRLKKSPLYKVIILNDDYTPMDFVVEVLQSFFHMDHNKAVQLMMTIHLTGQGICGIFTHEIAETKVASVNTHSQRNQYPLLSVMEPDSED